MTTRLTNLATPFTFQFLVTASGTPEQLTVKRRAATIAFVENQVSYSASTIAFVEGGASADTITDSVGGFVTAGFTAGGKIKVAGTASNDGTYTIDTVVAGTITLISADDLADELAGTAFTITQTNTGADTITDSASGFLVTGFQAGDQITVSGSTLNDGTYVIASVTAGKITLLARNDLITEAAGAIVKIVAPKTVPDGVAVTIKAMYANGGTIRIADSSAKALNTTTGGFGLRNNESVGLQVENISNVWLDATVSGEGVEVIFEKNVQA